MSAPRVEENWRDQIPAYLDAAKQWLVDFDAQLVAVDGDVDRLTVEQVNAALVKFTMNWARNHYDTVGLSALFGVPVTVADADVPDGYDDHSGPRQVLYHIGVRIFCKDARNISHIGWEWDEWEPVRIVAPSTRTITVYN